MKDKNLSFELFDEITKSDDLKNNMRRQLVLYDVIRSYPKLYNYLKQESQRRFNDMRLRRYPYLLSVITGKEKYSSDDFYTGFYGSSEEIQKEFKEWKEDFKNYIIDNEDLHTFWML